MLNNDRLARLALRTLEDALAQAQAGPVDRSWGQRLALSWLVQTQVAEEWQCAKFWMMLADECEWAHTPAIGHEMRVTTLMGFLDTWHLKLGVERPCLQARGKWARRYAADIDSSSGTPQHPCMCNRYQPGERKRIEDHFSAKRLREYNDGPATVHPKDPGWVVRLLDGAMVLEQMTWGFPVVLRGKQGQPLKPKPVNNARFDKLGRSGSAGHRSPSIDA